MTHWKIYTEVDTLRSFHLGGAEVVVTIERVEGGEIKTMEGGRPGKKRMPMVFFRGKKLPLGLNSINGNTIASLYGPHTEGWVGKQITLYPTTTSMAGKTVECIRVRPTVPQQKGADNAPE